MNTAKSDYEALGGDEALSQRLDGIIGNMSSVVSRSEISEEAKLGHCLVYICFVTSDPDTGDKVYGIAGHFYCDHSERLFDLFSTSTKSSTNEEALDFFRPFLDSIKCH